MAVWKLVEIVYNVIVIMAYVSAGLWFIAAITNMVRHIKRKRRNR